MLQDLISNAFVGKSGIIWCWNPIAYVFVKRIIIREIMESERFFNNRKDYSELFDPAEEIARQIEHGKRWNPCHTWNELSPYKTCSPSALICLQVRRRLNGSGSPDSM
jgi:hypothetical protein